MGKQDEESDVKTGLEQRQFGSDGKEGDLKEIGNGL